jgi:hypothetical protein
MQATTDALMVAGQSKPRWRIHVANNKASAKPVYHVILRHRIVIDGSSHCGRLGHRNISASSPPRPRAAFGFLTFTQCGFSSVTTGIGMPTVSGRAITRLRQSPVRRSRIKLGFRGHSLVYAPIPASQHPMHGQEQSRPPWYESPILNAAGGPA